MNRAHGRLGTGDNKCRHAPVRLKVWPPGFPGCVVKGIALGGAHSIVLAHRSVLPTTLANPWGVESLAYAWGYGYCGQLGLGREVRLECGGGWVGRGVVALVGVFFSAKKLDVKEGWRQIQVPGSLANGTGEMRSSCLIVDEIDCHDLVAYEVCCIVSANPHPPRPASAARMDRAPSGWRGQDALQDSL